MSGSSRQSGTFEKSLCRRLKIASALRCLRIPILPFCFFPSRLVIPIGSNHKPNSSESPAFSEHRQKFSYFFLKSQKKAFEFYSLSEDLYEEKMPRRTVFKTFGHKRELLQNLQEISRKGTSPKTAQNDQPCTQSTPLMCCTHALSWGFRDGYQKPFGTRKCSVLKCLPPSRSQTTTTDSGSFSESHEIRLNRRP